MAYSPIFKDGVRYSPRSSVRTSVMALVARCVSLTVAPDTAACEGSKTVPTMMALSTCCATAVGMPLNATAANTVASNDLRNQTPNRDEDICSSCFKTPLKRLPGNSGGY